MDSFEIATQLTAETIKRLPDCFFSFEDPDAVAEKVYALYRGIFLRINDFMSNPFDEEK